MKTKDYIYLAIMILLAFAPLVVIPWSERAGLTPGSSFEFYYPLYQWGVLAAGLFLLCRLILAIVRKAGSRALLWMIPALIWLVTTGVGFRMSREARMAGMAEFVQRSQSLVAAIKQFEQQHERPPETLKELVPDYLPEVLGTGMPVYPEYEYMQGATARERYADNPWVLIVDTPIAILNWDQMFYFPRQNYDELRFNSGLERVGDWAYNHE